jgi:hypothetical protein
MTRNVVRSMNSLLERVRVTDAATHGTTFNAETAELAEHNRFLCGFREFCVDRRGLGNYKVIDGIAEARAALTYRKRPGT